MDFPKYITFNKNGQDFQEGCGGGLRLCNTYKSPNGEPMADYHYPTKFGDWILTEVKLNENGEPYRNTEGDRETLNGTYTAITEEEFIWAFRNVYGEGNVGPTLNNLK